MLVRDVIADWSEFKRDLETKKYDAIEAEIEGKTYEIIQASRWSVELDEGRTYVKVMSTIADRKLGRLLHLIRDSGASILVTKSRQPFIVLVPGNDWAEHLSASVGASLGSIGKSVRRGPLKKIIGGNPKALRQRLDRERSVLDELKSLLAQKEVELRRAETEAANARSDRMSIGYEVGRLTRELDDLKVRIIEERARRQTFDAA